MDDAEAELDALRSFYYQEGEYMQRDCKNEKSSCITIKLNSESYTHHEKVRERGYKESELHQLYTCFISFLLPYTYPQEQIRDVKVSSSFLPDEVLRSVNNEVEKSRRESWESPLSLLELCSLCQGLVDEQIYLFIESIFDKKLVVPNCATVDDTKSSDIYNCKEDTGLSGHELMDQQNTKESSPHTCLLHLDHMRSRGPYIKLIRRWVHDLDLTGALMFGSKFILILLQGQASAVKEYIVRNRSTKVDVDSRGRPCKERLLTVLVDTELGTGHSLSGFEILEGPLDQTQLKEKFLTFGLDDIYNEYVKELR